jgi:hypothetical protein
MFRSPRIHPAAAVCQARENVVDVGRRDPWEMSSLGGVRREDGDEGNGACPRWAVSHGERDFYPEERPIH